MELINTINWNIVESSVNQQASSTSLYTIVGPVYIAE
jgi:hypothetical protein